MPRRFPNHTPDEEAVDRFAAAIRPYAPEGYSRDKAREGLGNLLEFVALLERWDAEDRRKAAASPEADGADLPTGAAS